MFNSAMLVGRVGNKEVKELKSGGEVTILSVATSKKWKDSTGQQQELTTWHNVNCFHKISDIAKKYVHVGDMILVQGEIQNKKIEKGDKAGQHIYSIHANDIRFIPGSNKKKENKQNEGELDFEETQIPF